VPALPVATGPATIVEISRRQTRQEQRPQGNRAAELMANIKGEDHQALAVLLDYRVGQLEERVEENGRAASAIGVEVAKVSVKIDTLIDLHQSTAQRLDAHLDKGDAPPRFTLTPIWLFAGASAIAAWAAAAYVAGKAATERFVTWFLSIIGA
jgi:hypothetical protein